MSEEQQVATEVQGVSPPGDNSLTGESRMDKALGPQTLECLLLPLCLHMSAPAIFLWYLTWTAVSSSGSLGASTFADMEAVVRRCPFLSRVPQAFLQKAGKSLLFYAQNCPKMMEVGAKPAPRTLSTSAVHCQQIKETPPANE
ncbi:hypothetical protein STEG23_030673, partial [Scotinomys teguina]